MRRRLALAAALAGATLSACVAGPHYRPPPSPFVSGGGFVSAAPAMASDAPPPEAWWRLYDDPTLDRLVEEAFVANKDLKIAMANLAQARAFLNEARSQFLPGTTLSASATYGRSQQANQAAVAVGRKPRPEWTYQPQFDALYEFDLWGRVRRGVEAARADSSAAAAAADVVRISVAAETARAYADACAAGQQANVARESLKLTEETYQLTVTQRDVGAASDFDVARVGALMEQARAAAPAFEGRRRVALFELAALLGKTPQQVPEEAAACAKPPTLHQALPVGDGAALLRRRPDVRQAERELAAATARVGVATAELFPTISLGGSISSSANRIGDLSKYAATAFGAGPLITWAFPNLWAAGARVQAAKAVDAAAHARFEAAMLRALKETEQALSTYGGELDRNAALQAATAHSEEAVRLAKVRFEAGGASYLELISAEQTLINAKAELAASAAALSDDQIAVFKALGGGWRNGAAARR